MDVDLPSKGLELLSKLLSMSRGSAINMRFGPQIQLLFWYRYLLVI